MKAFTLSLCVFLSTITNTFAQQSDSFSTTSLLLKIRDENNLSSTDGNKMLSGIPAVDAILVRHGVHELRPLFPPDNSDLELRQRLGLDRIFIARSQTPMNIISLVAELSERGEIEYAEPDYIGESGGRRGSPLATPNDTYFNRQWGYQNTGSNPVPEPGTVGADIKATAAWDVHKGDSSIIVGVLDSGLKWDHPDIAARVWTNWKEIPNNNKDDDANGYVDDVHGYNFAYNNANIRDDLGHGTNVASIIGAIANNNLGYAGLDWKCRIMPIKILDSTNFGLYSAWASALYYAANNGAKVMNMSVGGTGGSSTLENAVMYAYSKKCFIAACMMNTNNSVVYYPAGFNDYTVAVGATDSRDRRVNPFFWGGGSNFGGHIDVVAPGNYIYGLHHVSNTDYTTYWGGTSQATPMVAALASLLLAQNPTRTPTQLRTIIRSTADDKVGRSTEDITGFDEYHGYGRINCERALKFDPVHVEDDLHALPGIVSLSQNYPNPFQIETTIRFRIETNASHKKRVILRVNDLLGRLNSTLVDALYPDGEFEVRFRPKDIAHPDINPSNEILFYSLIVDGVRMATNIMHRLR